MVEFDEVLKGQPDVARSEAHFTVMKDDPELRAFQRNLEEDCYRVEKDVQKESTRKELLRFLRSPDFEVQLPTWNEADTLGPILEYLVEQLGDPNKIVVMDADSDDNSAEVARRHGARVVLQSDMYKCIKQDKFSDILQEKRPRGRGMTLFAFWLYRFLIQETYPRYACFVDTDIRNFREYDPLPFLAYPIVTEKKKNFLHVKVAKPGRGNEPVMSARCTLRAINDLGRRYFEQLSRDMWMLSGEYVVQPEHARTMPHATRSFVDTLISIYLADLAHEDGGQIALVAIPNSRLDKKNDNRKEQLIMYSISTNAVAFVCFGKPASKLTLTDIRHLNREVFNRYSLYPLIPDEPGLPMQATAIMNDRIIPSVQQLVENGLVIPDQVKKMKKKYPAAR